MTETNSRMVDRDKAPTRSEVAEWVGTEAYGYWKRVAGLIEESYPNVFAPEWLFGGKKHGWSLRYKKNKPLCTFIPDRGRFLLLIVFGAEERKSVESVRERLSAQTRKEYDDAVVYHDGKWVVLTIDSAVAVEDARLLLSLKRKPKTGKRS